MEFAMPSVTNATAEIAAADSYNRIRLFTVGTATQGQPGQAPLYDLQTVQQPWVVANSSTVGSDGVHYTQSSVAEKILSNWNKYQSKFVKVMPIQYKRVLEAIKRGKGKGLTEEEAIMEAANG